MTDRPRPKPDLGFLIPLKAGGRAPAHDVLRRRRQNPSEREDIMEISVEKVLDLVEHLRLLDSKDGDAEFDSGDDSYESGAGHLFEDIAEDGTEDQIRGVIEGLNIDEQAELVALVWIGRGDFEAEEWPVAIRRAHERAVRSTARYLMGIPNVGDLLEEGLAAVRADA